MENHKAVVSTVLCLTALCLFSASARPTVRTTSTVRKHRFVLEEQSITRLCDTQKVVTVNGAFPGPTIKIQEGDTVRVTVINRSDYNATIHWHGIFQYGTVWADGPEYVTQCPIMPGERYTYKFTVTDQVGTLWWHAHSSWLRATVYGAFIIYPKKHVSYPYDHPGREQILLLGEWWKANPMDVIEEALRIGGNANASDALTINGQPGALLPCSSSDITTTKVDKGEKILLRIINAAMNTDMFVKIADHRMTVVAADALYTKQYKTDYILLGPGQTTDVLVTASKSCGLYYMAARASVTSTGIPFDNTTTTALFQYSCAPSDAEPKLPSLPNFTDVEAAEKFSRSLRSLNSEEIPTKVPKNVDVNLFYTIGFSVLSCPENNCSGPMNQKLTTSMNNYSFKLPNYPILQAHYYNISGVYTTDFPDNPPLEFNYSDTNLDSSLWFTSQATKVRVLQYKQTVQLVFQGTGVIGGESHPMHLHGNDFYVVGNGKGNYDPDKDPSSFNLVDPPIRNTVSVPVNGWSAIRFEAKNPGVWTLHCHLDFHISMGLATVFIVEGGPPIGPPPSDLPKC